jgi:hypothetical protein
MIRFVAVILWVEGSESRRRHCGTNIISDLCPPVSGKVVTSYYCLPDCSRIFITVIQSYPEDETHRIPGISEVVVSIPLAMSAGYFV